MNHLFIGFLSLVGTAMLRADDIPTYSPYVYEIKATRPDGILLGTGFRINALNQNGLLTALHVVAGATNIRAANTNFVLDQFKIAAVNWSHDVALLTNANDVKQPGFNLLASLPTQNMEVLTISARQTLQDSKLARVDLRPFHQLGESLMNNPIQQEFASRNGSPSLDVDVLVLNNAGLGPGDSGAPVLDMNLNVIGMYEGGFFQYLEYWAVPQPELSKLEPAVLYETKLRDLPKPARIFHSIVDPNIQNTSSQVILTQRERPWIGRWKPTAIFKIDNGSLGTATLNSAIGTVEITGLANNEFYVKGDVSVDATASHLSFRTHTTQTYSCDSVETLTGSRLEPSAIAIFKYEYYLERVNGQRIDHQPQEETWSHCSFSEQGGHLILYLSFGIRPTGHDFRYALSFDKAP